MNCAKLGGRWDARRRPIRKFGRNTCFFPKGMADEEVRRDGDGSRSGGVRSSITALEVYAHGDLDSDSARGKFRRCHNRQELGIFKVQ